MRVCVRGWVDAWVDMWVACRTSTPVRPPRPSGPVLGGEYERGSWPTNVTLVDYELAPRTNLNLGARLLGNLTLPNAQGWVLFAGIALEAPPLGTFTLLFTTTVRASVWTARMPGDASVFARALLSFP